MFSMGFVIGFSILAFIAGWAANYLNFKRAVKEWENGVYYIVKDGKVYGEGIE